MFATARRKQLAVGLVFLAVMLGLFLWFNRIPKLDIVEADLAGATAPNVECFQGFCLESEPDSTLFSRWWDFSLAYLQLISLGMVFAFLMAGLTETFLLPQGSVYGAWTRPGVRGSLGGLLVGPAMNLCSACIVPVANAFRQRGAGTETALAIVHGSSTLNVPALLMAALVFTPMLAGSRVGISLIAALFLGPLVAWLAGRGRDSPPLLPGEGRGEGVSAVPLPEIGTPDADESTWRAVLIAGLKAWARASLRYFFRLAPVMVLAGFASALVIQWVSPETVGEYLGNNLQGVAIAATLGLLINVPLMFEIPLVAALLLVGMGEAPAATLLFAAAAGGPVTFWGLLRAMPKRAVASLAAATWGLGLVGGLGILAVGPVVGGEGVGIRASVTSGPAEESTPLSLWLGDTAEAATGELRIERIEPAVVGTDGQVLVTVHGSGFVDGAGVTLDGVEAAWAFLGPDRLVAFTPPHAPGAVDAVVTNPDGSSVSLANALTYQLPVFEEVSEQSGAAFIHYRSQPDIIPLSAGVVVFDYNGDGWQDAYVTTTPDIAGLAPEGDDKNGLFRNNGDGTFTNVAEDAGVTDAAGRGNGGCAADYDNDGDQDLFVANWGASKLFRNDGDGKFTDVAESAGLADPDGAYRSMGCAWGDYDRDGWLDFIVVRHIDESNPDAFTQRAYYLDARPLALFRNDGDGALTEVTHLLGATPSPSREAGAFGRVWGAGFQPAWVDYDNDGDLDLYVVNDFGEYVHPNVLWRNDGPAQDGGRPHPSPLPGGEGVREWVFTDVSQESGAGIAMSGRGLAVSDYNSDGYLDMFITNIADNVLLTNDGGDTFRDAAGDMGVAYGEFRRQQRVSWGTVFFDYDNDGYEDLYVASGFLDTDDINRREQPNLLFRNDGAGGFEDVSAISGAADWGTGRGVAYADFDGDGCLDLFLVNMGRSAAMGEPARLYHNRCVWGNNWLTVKTVGTASNRDGIGARITLTANGRAQIREIAAGSSNSSQNMLPVHFGLGQAKVVDELRIKWPSGTLQTLRDVAPNQVLTVVEP